MSGHPGGEEMSLPDQRAALERLAELLRTRNEVEAEISKVIGVGRRFVR
jgi:hypothetical protein